LKRIGISESFHIARALPGARFDATIDAVRAALTAEGFGVLTEIDVAPTLKAKPGIDHPAYRILGACNPGFAHRASQVEGKIGALLPCNVIIQDRSSGDMGGSALSDGDVAGPAGGLPGDAAFAAAALQGCQLMSKLLQEAVANMLELPEDQQERTARMLIAFTYVLGAFEPTE
jgi:hypothetical protein